MSFNFALWLAGFLVYASTIVCSPSSPVVDLGYARYRGSTDLASNITSFLGIRYATPPTGSLRFQAPKPPGQVAGTQNATTFPPQCWQATVADAAGNTTAQRRDIVPTSSSEDCLFLDVVVPNIATARGLPVVVWIHGGGFVAGNISQYQNSDLTADSDNRAITVLIQYRLSVLGFLAGPEVKEKGALNAGLLDQNLALQWVQKHISSVITKPCRTFDRDSPVEHLVATPRKSQYGAKVPVRIIYLGATSVLQHIVAHGGRTNPPLFRNAITSSTILTSQYPADGLIPSQIYEAVANMSGCLATSDSFACLVSADAQTLADIGETIDIDAFYTTFAFVPVIDGQFILERPTLTLDRREVNGNALLSVTNTFEGRFFTPATVSNITGYIQSLFPLMTTAQVEDAVQVYALFNNTWPNLTDQAVAIRGESIFICPTYDMLRAFPGKSWKGEFAIPPGDHGDDIPYYFTSMGPPYNNTDFVNSFSKSFLAMVLAGDPNVKFDPADRTPNWKTWSVGATEMLFNETSTGQPEILSTSTDPGVLTRCAFWKSVAANIAQ
ncbi:alpha/beta-hydrolase [Athelia psychrophila]|uniref:Alpha/beta-hydrolase n=1 Tax=Athelia psychrophila TaxID=1759441 RepID=A0A166PVB0_9AGAM|nr:alpha/beta-hydrolase [Fibularhizoctonia sp. CBS 109695]